MKGDALYVPMIPTGYCMHMGTRSELCMHIYHMYVYPWDHNGVNVCSRARHMLRFIPVLFSCAWPNMGPKKRAQRHRAGTFRSTVPVPVYYRIVVSLTYS